LGKRKRTKNVGLGFFYSDTISSDAPNFQIINDTKVQIILQKQKGFSMAETNANGETPIAEPPLKRMKVLHGDEQ